MPRSRSSGHFKIWGLSFDRLPSLIGPCLRWGGRVLIALLVFAVVVGSMRVREEVRRDERYLLDTWKLQFVDFPEWVTPEIQAELEAIDLRREGGRPCLFDPGVLASIRERLESSPWIQSVSGIGVNYPTFESPGILELEIRWRRPTAIVEQNDLYYLADAEGRRLGSPYREPHNEWFGVPTISGLERTGEPPLPGASWGSRDLQQGIEVARVLLEHQINREFPHNQITRIDLTNLHGRLAPRQSEIVLRCGSQKLAWGRSPISAAPRTVTVPQLIANLRFVLSHPETFGGLAVIHLHRRPEVLTGVRG